MTERIGIELYFEEKPEETAVDSFLVGLHELAREIFGEIYRGWSTRALLVVLDAPLTSLN